MKADVLFSEANLGVVQLPTRNTPGLVIQGDTLRSMLSQVEKAESGEIDQGEVLMELAGGFRWMLAAYERALDEHGVEIPYTNRVSPQRSK